MKLWSKWYFWGWHHDMIRFSVGSDIKILRYWLCITKLDNVCKNILASELLLHFNNCRTNNYIFIFQCTRFNNLIRALHQLKLIIYNCSLINQMEILYHPLTIRFGVIFDDELWFLSQYGVWSGYDHGSQPEIWLNTVHVFETAMWRVI